MRRASGKRPSVWESPPSYGTYVGERGHPWQWRRAYEEAVYSRDKALSILSACDSPRDILGVSESATAEEIKAAWRRLVMEHHPDKGGDKEKFEKIMAAYSILAA